MMSGTMMTVFVRLLHVLFIIDNPAFVK